MTQLRRLLSSLLLCSFAAISPAQTLARPGWAGSGLGAEPWWRAGVFYLVRPPDFQDSDSDGQGDLSGIAQRLDYIQSLGVDAIVLQPPFDEAGFDDLLDAAIRRHIRLLVQVADTKGVDAAARHWLTRGAAGLWVRLSADATPETAAASVKALAALTHRFPGDRILVEDTSANLRLMPVVGASLVVRTIEGVVSLDPALLRQELVGAGNVPKGSAPVLVAGFEPQRTDTLAEPQSALAARTLAAMLFGARSAVAFHAGEELGIPSAQAPPQVSPTRRLMQWTPSNVTPPAEPPPEAKPAAPPPREDVYGAFVPYVPPKPPKRETAESRLNALPGFTSGELPKDAQPANANILNVAAEEGERSSLLWFYRRLSELHHGNAALRSGGLQALPHDAEGVLAWVRPAPAGGNGVSVVIACNFSGKYVTVSLRDDFSRLKLPGGDLRVLLATSPGNTQALQTTASMTLTPGSLLVAEVDR